MVALRLALLASAVATSVGHERPEEGVLAHDDECSEESDSCSQHFLQKAFASPARLPRELLSQHPLPELPHGPWLTPTLNWVPENETDDTEVVSVESLPDNEPIISAKSVGCASYGCGGYNPAHSCQCNSQCGRHNNCCHDYHSKCVARSGGGGEHSHSFHHGRVVNLYHQTNAEAGHSILAHGFRPGHEGYCGGGIYFADNPISTYTKAVGADSHQGFFIEARVDLGRERHIEKPSCFSPKVSKEHLSRRSTASYLHEYNADSFNFNPWDGTEYVIADPRRVLAVRQIYR